MNNTAFVVEPIGLLRSELTNRADAPRQGYEGAPAAWIEINARVASGLDGLAVGDDVIVLTWLHQAQRDVLRVHPRDDISVPMAGVFATRSPDRPNPVGLHRVTILEVEHHRLKVAPIEAIDGTPVIDIKPVLDRADDA